VSDYLVLTPQVREQAESWLDLLEARVGVIEDGARQLPDSEAASLRQALEDVRSNTAFARAAFSGIRPLTELPSAYCVVPTHPSRELATLIHTAGEEFAGTPWPMIEYAKATLEDSHRRPFLTVVGTVLASVFTSLTQGVWNDYPEYAPEGWNKPKPSDV
jgi:hypothetical protein